MAIGTITTLVSNPQGNKQATNLGDLRVSVTTVVGDSSYPTGGSSVTAANLTLNQVLFAVAFISASSGSNCSAVSASYIVSSSLLQCFSAADSSGDPVSETGNGVNLSGLTWTIVAFGY